MAVACLWHKQGISLFFNNYFFVAVWLELWKQQFSTHSCIGHDDSRNKLIRMWIEIQKVDSFKYRPIFNKKIQKIIRRKWTLECVCIHNHFRMLFHQDKQQMALMLLSGTTVKMLRHDVFLLAHPFYLLQTWKCFCCSVLKCFPHSGLFSFCEHTEVTRVMTSSCGVTVSLN